MPELPIACTLQPGELTTRTAELLPGVARLADVYAPIENGYRFEFLPNPDCLGAIAAMINVERRCCRFMRFQLTVESDTRPILDVTGPAGTQAFLSELIAAQGGALRNVSPR